MSQILDRRNALKMGLFAIVGVGALSHHAEASTGLQSQNEAVSDGILGQDLQSDGCKRLAAPDMLLKYSLHEPRRGREDINSLMHGFRTAFPDLNCWGTAPLLSDGDYVIGQ